MISDMRNSVKWYILLCGNNVFLVFFFLNLMGGREVKKVKVLVHYYLAEFFYKQFWILCHYRCLRIALAHIIIEPFLLMMQGVKIHIYAFLFPFFWQNFKIRMNFHSLTISKHGSMIFLVGSICIYLEVVLLSRY